MYYIDLTIQRVRELRGFVLVGSAAAVGYFLFAFVLERIGYSAATASTLAFASMMPLSYLGHRKHTFQSSGRPKSEIPKFIVVSLAGLATGAFVPYLVCSVVGMPAWVAFLTVCLVAPLISYVAFRSWVFRRDDASVQ